MEGLSDEGHIDELCSYFSLSAADCKGFIELQALVEVMSRAARLDTIPSSWLISQALKRHILPAQGEFLACTTDELVLLL